MGFGAGEFFKQLPYLRQLGIKLTFTSYKNQQGKRNGVKIAEFNRDYIQKKLPFARVIIFSSLTNECEQFLKNQGLTCQDSKSWHFEKLNELLSVNNLGSVETLISLARIYHHLQLFEDEMRIRLEIVSRFGQRKDNDREVRVLHRRLKDFLGVPKIPVFTDVKGNFTKYLEGLILNTIRHETEDSSKVNTGSPKINLTTQPGKGHHLFFLGSCRLNGITISGIETLRRLAGILSNQHSRLDAWTVIICTPIEIELSVLINRLKIGESIQLILSDNLKQKSHYNLELIVNIEPDGSVTECRPENNDLLGFLDHTVYSNIFVYNPYRTFWLEKLSTLPCSRGRRFMWLHNRHVSEMIKYPSLKTHARIIKNFDKYVFVSQDSLCDNQPLISALKISTSACLVQPNFIQEVSSFNNISGVNYNCQSNFDHPLKLLFVGRLAYDKRPDLVMKVAHRIYNDDPNLQLDVIGAGALEAELVARARSENMNFINFLGPIPSFHTENWNYDALLLLSEREGLPLVALEAMSRGLWVICNKRSGLAYFESNGYSTISIDDDLEFSVADILLKIQQRPRIKFSIPHYNMDCEGALRSNFFRGDCVV